MLWLDTVKKAPGVYLMLDLDSEPAYAGQTTNLWKRLRDHLVNQRSDVITDVLLDVYEVREVVIWYRIEELELPLRTDDDDNPEVLAKREPLDVMESAIIKHFKPRWNRAKGRFRGMDLPGLTLDNCDQRIPILSEAELVERTRPIRRIEAKLLHLLRAVRKASVSGESRRVMAGLRQHATDLRGLCQHGPRRRGGSPIDEDDRESFPPFDD
jgi:hypothetical protein